MRSLKTESGGTTSIWMATAEIPPRPPLQRDLKTDVCIVGAGIAGLSVAYALVKNGRRVVVIDDGPIAGGETGRTTAHLTNALDDRYFEIEKLLGADAARLAVESHTAAINSIEHIVEETGADCEFTRLDGYLFAPPGESGELLKEELEAARRAGLEVDLVPRAPIADFDTGPALRFPNQAQFHPTRYLAAVAKAIEAAGGMLFEGTFADEIHGGDDAHVKTKSGHTISAGDVVVATNTPINDLVTMHTKQAPYRTYVIGLNVPKGSVERALYWDTADPYHYVRLQRGDGTSDVLIVGGEDHRTGQADDGDVRFARLEAWAKERFPMVRTLAHKWSGQVMEPVDSLAFIGKNPGDEHVYIATGDSGNGMTHGTIAGLVITPLILGRNSDWAEIYEPSRKTLRAIGAFARENVDSQKGYGGWFTGSEVESVDRIAPGEGAVVRRGLSKVAVYRSSAGKLVERSAVCPHLGCIVAWNRTEESWDCPCHGSRFGTDGHVLNGPAGSALKAVEPNGEDR